MIGRVINSTYMQIFKREMTPYCYDAISLNTYTQIRTISVKFVSQLATLPKKNKKSCVYLYHLLLLIIPFNILMSSKCFLYLLPLYLGAYVNIGFVNIVVCNRKWLILYRNLKFTFISRYSHLWYYVTLFLLGVSVDCVYQF